MQNIVMLTGIFLIFLIISKNCKGYPMSNGLEQSPTSSNQPHIQPIPAQPHQPPLQQLQNQPPLQLQPHQPPLQLQQNQPPLQLQPHQPPLQLQQNQPPIYSQQNMPPVPPRAFQPPVPSQVHQAPLPPQAYQPQVPSQIHQSQMQLEPHHPKIPSGPHPTPMGSQPHQSGTPYLSNQSPYQPPIQYNSYNPSLHLQSKPQYHYGNQSSSSQHHRESRPSNYPDQQAYKQYPGSQTQQQPLNIQTPPPPTLPQQNLAPLAKPKPDFGFTAQYNHVTDIIESVPIPYMKYDKNESPVLHYGNDGLEEEYGDRRVFEGEFPYFVQIRVNNEHVCGGALIKSPITGKQVVLTAHHCFMAPGTTKLFTPQQFTLRMGVYGLNEYTQERKTVAMLGHSGFITFGPTHRPVLNDIAMLIPDSEFILNEHAQFVDLTEANLPTRWHDVIIKGFGKGREAGHMEETNYMRTISVPVWDNQVCNKAYYDESGAQLITDGHFCAAHRTGGLDSCQGDSGGPATAIEGGTLYLVGVVSWGKGCGKAEYPGVYVKVWSYRNWIKRTLFDYEINGVLPPKPKYHH